MFQWHDNASAHFQIKVFFGFFVYLLKYERNTTWVFPILFITSMFALTTLDEGDATSILRSISSNECILEVQTMVMR